MCACVSIIIVIRSHTFVSAAAVGAPACVCVCSHLEHAVEDRQPSVVAPVVGKHLPTSSFALIHFHNKGAETR